MYESSVKKCKPAGTKDIASNVASHCTQAAGNRPSLTEADELEFNDGHFSNK